MSCARSFCCLCFVVVVVYFLKSCHVRILESRDWTSLDRMLYLPMRVDVCMQIPLSAILSPRNYLLSLICYISSVV